MQESGHRAQPAGKSKNKFVLARRLQMLGVPYHHHLAAATVPTG